MTHFKNLTSHLLKKKKIHCQYLNNNFIIEQISKSDDLYAVLRKISLSFLNVFEFS